MGLTGEALSPGRTLSAELTVYCGCEVSSATNSRTFRCGKDTRRRVNHSSCLYCVHHAELCKLRRRASIA